MSKTMEYEYVGQKDLLKLVNPVLTGTCLNNITDIENWIIKTNQKPDTNSEIIATFIIDKENNLRINDRHSEHVVCANGNPVLSDYFTTVFIFRICGKCKWINVVKDNYFVCVNCENELPSSEE